MLESILYYVFIACILAAGTLGVTSFITYNYNYIKYAFAAFAASLIPVVGIVFVL